MLFALVLVVIGILSAAPLIIARRPDARQWIEKLAMFQGWIGAGAAILGGWSLIDLITRTEQMGLAWLTGLAVAVLLACNGFLLAFSLGITLFKDEEVKEKAMGIYESLLPYQTKLGLAAIVLGLWGAVRGVLMQ